METNAEIHFDDGDILPITLRGKDSFEAMNFMRDLLERDTAAEPVNTWAYRGYGPLVGYCPSCGSYVEENFCGYCGKKLVWKGEKAPRPKREY